MPCSSQANILSAKFERKKKGIQIPTAIVIVWILYKWMGDKMKKEKQKEGGIWTDFLNKNIAHNEHEKVSGTPYDRSTG